jgi:hypothetical protein
MIDCDAIMNQGDESGYLERNNVGIGQIPISDNSIKFM